MWNAFKVLKDKIQDKQDGLYSSPGLISSCHIDQDPATSSQMHSITSLKQKITPEYSHHLAPGLYYRVVTWDVDK